MKSQTINIILGGLVLVLIVGLSILLYFVQQKRKENAGMPLLVQEQNAGTQNSESQQREFKLEGTIGPQITVIPTGPELVKYTPIDLGSNGFPLSILIAPINQKIVFRNTSGSPITLQVSGPESMSMEIAPNAITELQFSTTGEYTLSYNQAVLTLTITE